jgi:hypothetical protein
LIEASGSINLGVTERSQSEPVLMTELAASTVSHAPDDSSELESTAPATPPAGPSRSDAPVSEVTERFLRAIIAKVPLERIEELHLFAPLRQGAVETGIAVVAARVPLQPVAEVEEPPESELSPEQQEQLALEEDESEEIEAKDDVLAEEASDDEPIAYPGEAEDSVQPTPVERHTVYTARYRLVVKGPERGRWESDVVAEADAPLLTVETVVRGVQRRAGEETEILLFSDRQIARALRMSWPLPDATPATGVIADPAA